MSWTVLCPAKLNLFLAVGACDARGWHPLRTRFQCISLFDRLTVGLADRESFSSNVEYLSPDNTVTRALELIRRHHPIPPLDIRLVKKIPAQSGLGGGSSDAAGLLRIVREFLLPEISSELLSEIAFHVGADVPFFLVGGRSDAESYGEKLRPLSDPKVSHYVVVKPAVDCPTPAMFRALDALSYPWLTIPEEDRLYNDFERVMPPLCRDQIERLLAGGAQDAGLSGSGSAVFGRFETSTEAMTAAELIKNEGEDMVWACQSLTREDSLNLSTHQLDR